MPSIRGTRTRGADPRVHRGADGGVNGFRRTGALQGGGELRAHARDLPPQVGERLRRRSARSSNIRFSCASKRVTTRVSSCCMWLVRTASSFSPRGGASARRAATVRSLSSSRTFCMRWRRAEGSLARHPASRRSAAGLPELGGLELTMAAARAAGLSPSKARRPVSISYTTAPKEKMSLRASGWWPSRTSGARVGRGARGQQRGQQFEPRPSDHDVSRRNGAVTWPESCILRRVSARIME